MGQATHHRHHHHNSCLFLASLRRLRSVWYEIMRRRLGRLGGVQIGHAYTPGVLRIPRANRCSKIDLWHSELPHSVAFEESL